MGSMEYLQCRNQPHGPHERNGGSVVTVTIKVTGLSAAVEMSFEQKEAEKSAVGTSLLCGDIDVRNLSTEVAGGFVGCTVGMYAVADTDSRSEAACFTSLSYEAK